MRDRAAKATEGPWEPVDLDYEVNGETVTGADHGWWWVWQSSKKPYYGGVLNDSTQFSVTSTHDGKTYKVAGAVGEANISDGKTKQEKLDAEFISAARTDVPRLARILWDLLDLLDEKDLADQYAEKVGYQGGNPGLIEVSEIRALLEPEDVASNEDTEKAVEDALKNAGLTREELLLQGQTGQFSSTQARLAWVAVGDLL
jgi:hypothetical protein